MTLTVEELGRIVDYDPVTGSFRWRERGKGRRAHVGRYRHGRLQIGIGYKRYFAHRLAWLYVYGRWPFQIDHINGDPTDNRIANLRETTQQQNLWNSRAKSHNKSGLKGVSWHKQRQVWRADIRAQGKKKHLGYFETKEAAHEAYVGAATGFFGEYART